MANFMRKGFMNHFLTILPKVIGIKFNLLKSRRHTRNLFKPGIHNNRREWHFNPKDIIQFKDRPLELIVDFVGEFVHVSIVPQIEEKSNKKSKKNQSRRWILG
ncbi:MAG: hypothetical protein RL621_17 [Bacteroidota bacterium]